MVWAEFIHPTSAPVDGIPDPQLHLHAFVFNTTWDGEESRWKAGQFRELKRDAPYFQAAFRVRLANRLQDLGLASSGNVMISRLRVLAAMCSSGSRGERRDREGGGGKGHNQP